MRLVSLNIKNYRQFKETSVEFPDGIIGIVGLNGSGKSSLVEAVAWALYGNVAARTGKDIIKRDTAPASASCEATLEMTLNGDSYKIIRALKGSSLLGEATIYVNGRLLANSVREVDKAVAHTLNMDYNSFYTSFFAQQKELNRLTALRPAERKDTIIRMLSIDAVDKAIDLIRTEARRAKERSEVIKEGLPDKNILIAEQMAKRKEFEGVESSYKDHQKILSEIAERKRAIAEKFNKEKEKYEKYNEFRLEYTKISTAKKGHEAELERLREERDKNYPSQLKELEIKKAKLESFRKDLAGKDKKALELRTLEEEESKLDSQRDELIILLEQISSLREKEAGLERLKNCPTCGLPLTGKNRETIKKHFLEEKKKIELKLKKLPEKAKLESQIKELEKSIKKLSDELGVLKERADRFASLDREIKKDAENLSKVKTESEERIKKLKEDLAQEERKLKEIEKAGKELAFDKETHDKLAREYEEIQDIESTQKDKVHKFELEHKTIFKDLERIELQLKDYDKKETEIKSLIKDQERRSKLAEIMDDFRINLISRIRPELSDVAGRLFSNLTDGKYGSLELDENYEMWIMDNGVKYQLSRFSGGEGDLANLCLRLAISHLISASSGTEGGFIILDEIFGSQDVTRKNSIMTALAQLSKQYRQIILITHVEEIKDFFEHIIEVEEDESGISHARLI